jgi:hypothetical protein
MHNLLPLSYKGETWLCTQRHTEAKAKNCEIAIYKVISIALGPAGWVSLCAQFQSHCDVEICLRISSIDKSELGFESTLMISTQSLNHHQLGPAFSLVLCVVQSGYTWKFQWHF